MVLLTWRTCLPSIVAVGHASEGGAYTQSSPPGVAYPYPQGAMPGGPYPQAPSPPGAYPPPQQDPHKPGYEAPHKPGYEGKPPPY